MFGWNIALVLKLLKQFKLKNWFFNIFFMFDLDMTLTFGDLFCMYVREFHVWWPHSLNIYITISVCLIYIRHVERLKWTNKMAAILDAFGYQGNRQDTKCLPSIKVNFRHPPTQPNQETLWTKNAHKYLQGLEYWYTFAFWLYVQLCITHSK